MVNIQDLLDDARCYETVRSLRWPDGVVCPHCSSASVIKNGRDDTQPDRQRYECRGCGKRCNFSIIPGKMDGQLVESGHDMEVA